MVFLVCDLDGTFPLEPLIVDIVFVNIQRPMHMAGELVCTEELSFSSGLRS